MARRKQPIKTAKPARKVVVEPKEKSYWLLGTALLFLGSFLLISLVGLDTGTIGRNLVKGLRFIFGVGAFFVPAFFIGGAFYLFFKKKPFWAVGKFYGWIGVAFSVLILLHQALVPLDVEIMPENLLKYGGLVGGFFVLFSRKFIGNSGTWLVGIGGFLVFGLYAGIDLFRSAKSRYQDEFLGNDSFGEEEDYEDYYDEEPAPRAAPERRMTEAQWNLVEKKKQEKKVFDFQEAKLAFEEEDDFYSQEPIRREEKKSFWEDFVGKIPVFRSFGRKSEGPVPWEDGYDDYVQDERRKWEEEKEAIKASEIEPLKESIWEFDRSLDGAPALRRKTPILEIEDEPEDELEEPFENVHETASPPVQLNSHELAELNRRAEEDQRFAEEREENYQKALAEKPRPKKVLPYKLPPLSLLNGSGKKAVGGKAEIREKAAVLEKTLEEFGVKARVTNYSQGPAVTRFELELAPGVKVNKILNLTDDLSLKLATTGLRIEAPIPGKAAVGIEVPNKSVASVSLKDVLDTEEFKTNKSKLRVGFGKDIAGNPVVSDLAGMPHLLVAGATGSGKSVCINTIICSILFTATPEEVKFIMVDPKMVELTNYNDIPHLLTPVVNDPKQAAAALRWAVREMESRYSLLAAGAVRDLHRYNELAEIHGQTKLPQIVVIIDELADLMMTSPVEVQDAICRLAQKARAAGIHLILATQRPSVDVITGLIKANIPSRISFAVSSQIDSRTILDMGGAEKLLGKGDMLYAPAGMAKPLRVQGAFISDDEVVKLLDFIKNQHQDEPEYVEGITADTGESSGGDSSKNHEEKDELWDDALRIIMETGQASTSMLQRRFRIGFSRAGRLIDQMEVLGIIGPPQGSKPRELMMSPDQIYNRYLAPDSGE